MLKRFMGACLLCIGVLLLASPLLIGQVRPSFILMGTLGTLAGLAYMLR